ncbi:translesion DNA synthesis-associated protein ImuA [Acidiferrobacter sp.]|uniref:translesion DNA synthesis-associated protein ImuA n=1 Tax=Acidiferrobacter sp. TaxID=1872107 RepID=UPI00263755D0|nr:translesion DNA synthesis-associated protein ImuA [Acidiferrobacter sp.]
MAWAGVGEGIGVRRGVAPAQATVMPTGSLDLDRRLEGGGWPAGVLTELRVAQMGIGEVRLLLPALAALSREGRLMWVAPPYGPYAPALAAHDVVLDHLIVVRPRTHKEALWAVGQGLLSPAVGAVVSWFTDIRDQEFRALQRYAAQGGRWGFCFLPSGLAPKPSRLRLLLESVPGGLRITFVRKAGRPAPPLVVVP